MVSDVTEYIVQGSFTPQSVVGILQSLKYYNVKDEPTVYTRSVEITVSVHAHLVLQLQLILVWLHVAVVMCCERLCCLRYQMSAIRRMWPLC